VKACGSVLEQAIERRGQHVLTRVLLHVIESASPSDLASHAIAGGERSTDDVNDLGLLIDCLEDLDRAKTTGVEGLTA
jgi:hypothetical protein